MWPFRKKPSKAAAVSSFQEFLKTYEQPPQLPVKNPIQEETICPLCFERFAAGTVSADHPSCPDCASEGMDFGVESLAAFLANKSSGDLDKIALRWQAAEGFLPQYKALKLERISQLMALKKDGC
jgi:hypothetical protein